MYYRSRSTRPYLFCRVMFFITMALSTFLPRSDLCLAAIIPSYVGVEQCRGCHQKEYERFVRYAKKSRSYESIERVKKGLSEEELGKCYACHTTGYGRPGGFISAEKTPHLKNAGCEVCHGPGEEHLKTRSRLHIKRQMTMGDCETCHISERVKAFRYKPLIHGGAH